MENSDTLSLYVDTARYSNKAIAHFLILSSSTSIVSNSIVPVPNPTDLGSTIINILDYRGDCQGNTIAYEFYTGDNNFNSLTYGELNGQINAIASILIEKKLTEERVLLIYPSGLEFIAAFLGCLKAGAIAVPMYPPRRDRRSSRLENIINDCEPVAVLTTSSLQVKVESYLSKTNTLLNLIATDSITQRSAKINTSKISPDKIAFLQYTSGSTGNPKGVTITHKNIIHNSALIYRCFKHTPETKVVSWLPFYHDMGLIGGILQPLFGGFPVSLFSSTDFIRKPLLWLETISRFKATTSGAPNFAYEMCIDKITSQEKKKLDLSSWDLAFIGAEPIQAETIDKFAEAFAECGFKKSAFYPCYGMAEATLMISGGIKANLPVVNKKDNKNIVGCGTVTSEQPVIIVNPDTKAVCQEEIGEIWVEENDNIADGYWNNTPLTKEIFKAKINSRDRSYLRTGDLGFIQGNELFISGRIKDVIIIRGQNYYPQDIERTVERSHRALKANSGAAFCIEVEGKEQLVIVQEVERSFVRKLGINNDPPQPMAVATTEGTSATRCLPFYKGGEFREQIKNAVTAAISQEFGLNVYDIQLIKTGSICKTSSGKIQRYLCKERYLAEQRENPPQPTTVATMGGTPTTRSLPLQKGGEGTKGWYSCSRGEDKKIEEIIDWLRDYAEQNINSQLIDERRCIPPYIVLDFGNKGLLGMLVPEEYGGLGLNNYQTMQILEQLGAIDTTVCLFVGLNNILGIRPILKYGKDELKKELLPILATGRELAAFALTEKNAGSNPQAIISKAIATSKNTWNIQGEKIWSGSAAWAGVTNVFVQHQDLNGDRQGISAFAVRRDTPGLRQGKESLTMGMRGMVQNTVYFDDVRVTSGQLLGKPGKGMEVAQDAMMYGRVAIASSCLGGMKRCAQLMLRYTNRRQVSTGRLLDNPVILNRLGGLTAQITAVECLVTQIARLLDKKVTIPVELYTACKTSAPEFYWQAADELVQFLGGRGYIETNIAPQILRDARVLRIFEGPTETLNMFLGSRIVNCKIAQRRRGAKEGALSKDAKNDFVRFIRDVFNSGDVGEQLFEAVERIEQHFENNPVFGKSIDNKRWIYSLVGEIATYAILLAATRYSYSLNSTREIERAIAWIELQFKRKIEDALTVTPNRLAPETADLTSELIDSYQQAIGNIQQSLPGEEREIDELLRIREWHSPRSNKMRSLLKVSPPNPPNMGGGRNQSIQDWLSQWLSNKLQIPFGKIDRTLSFADYGIDSVMAVELAQDLEEWLPDDLEIEPTLAWNFPSIEALAGYLAGEQKENPPTTRSLPLQKGGEEAKGIRTKDIENLSEDELARSLLAEIALAQGRDN